MRYGSIVTWPEGTPGLAATDNRTMDVHDSKEAAMHVCAMLAKTGMGGEGKIFPLETEVGPVDDEDAVKIQTLGATKYHKPSDEYIIRGFAAMALANGAHLFPRRGEPLAGINHTRDEAFAKAQREQRKLRKQLNYCKRNKG